MAAMGSPGASGTARAEGPAGRARPHKTRRPDATKASGARWQRPAALPPFLALLLISRVAATGTAVALLAAHRVTDDDTLLIAIVTTYAAAWTIAVYRWPGVTGRPWTWVADVAVVHALLWYSSDWRSPFYLLALSSLALPAAHLGARRALIVGFAYAELFLLTGHFIGPDPLGLGSQASLETLAIHLVLPVLLCFGIGYAAETLRTLARERRRGERLAIETERRRIAWELHDSAKQRIHAAHLVLSSAAGGERHQVTAAVEHAMGELGAASADMDTSLAELRSPLEGRPLDVALRERAAQLSGISGPRIEVRGSLPGLSPLHAAHAYRIAAEALTNALRHSRAAHVVVDLRTEDGDVAISVTDDGRGMPSSLRPGASGLLAMDNRARTLGGVLHIEPSGDDGGTRVEARFPLSASQAGASA